MAISKDPQTKKIPGTPSGAPAAKTPDSAKPRDDFSFDLNNLYRKHDDILRDKETAQERFLEEIKRFATQLAATNHVELAEEDTALLSAEMMEKMGQLTSWDLLRIDQKDAKAMSMRMGEVKDYETGQKYYLVGKALETYEARRAAETYLGGQPQTGSSRPHGNISEMAAGRPHQEFRVAPTASLKGQLVDDIAYASKVTGVPAALIGAMAGIESGFGKNKLSPTGAVGTFQQTGGYRDTNWAKHGAFIAQHVPEARAAMEGGLSKDEKKALAFNDRSAALMTALAAKDFAAARGIDLNDKKNWWIVYAQHNAGDGSVNKLLRNDMPDKFIRDCNPAIFRGKDTPVEIVANYQSKIMGYANAYEKLETNLVASAKVETTVALAKASASSATAVKTAKADLPTPELKPV